MQVSAYLKLSVAVAVATIALKTGAWWLTGSVSLLSDAMESGVNLAGAVFALMMVTLAAQPPDADHPYGHHKAEYFSSGFEGVLIFVAALAIGALLKQANLVPSTSEAMRLVEQGGVRVDGASISDKGLKLGAGTYVLQVGKRKFARVTLAA